MDNQADVVCFSHLRYRFVFQRPNHLMSRFARERRVFYVEEPLENEGDSRLEFETLHDGLCIVTPKLGERDRGEATDQAVARLLEEAFRERGVSSPVVWFYTPMMLPWASQLEPSLVVYDCMDELSGFWGANPLLLERERQLFDVADLVFTGGHSLFEAKKQYHPSVHAFPSSVDSAHFAKARAARDEPADQEGIAHPRVGYFGVIDERLDLELLAALADQRPHYQWIMVGPVVKISADALPKRPNIHYLGSKTYDELPSYIAGWDVAMMPFALNAATRFISPTKTLEYLAAGKPIASTAIHDVVTPYGRDGAVLIATPALFAEAVDRCLSQDGEAHRALADAILARTSWDTTWNQMSELMRNARHEPVTQRSFSQGDQPCSTI